MMPLDPVVGGVALRRPAIQSPDYVPATSGWTINQDGTVEFNSGTFRGTVTAGVFEGSDFVINSAGFFMYSGTPAAGNLIGSWAPTAGTDDFDNMYPAGLSVLQGVITGADIDSTTITNSTFQGDILTDSTLSNPNIEGGTVTETTITFDQSGGLLLVYTSTTTVVTQTTAGTYSITFPADTSQAKVEAWGAGAGGDGGGTSQGGNAAGAGEYAAEGNYPITGGGTYDYTVGAGGSGSSTGGGHGSDGGDSFFDSLGVIAHGGSGNGDGGTGSTNTTHHDGGSGGGNPFPNTGGSSGGNSGNATAKGNNGTTATSNSGAAAPASQSGSGRGGAGGNNGANGSNGSGPGGGGGGAGAGSSSTTKTKSYSPVWIGSYYGPDADGSVANTRRSTSTMYQGGETSGGGSFNGNQRCVFGFNRTSIASDFSGYTITHCKLTITNQHSWYNSGMTIEFDRYSGLPGSVPSTYPSGDFDANVVTGTIAEGDTHTYDLGGTVGQGFVTGSTNGLGLGAQVASNHPYNLNYYGYFSSAITLEITGTIGSGSENAGDGADGKVQITYTSGQTLVASIAPAAGTDQFGNAYPAGIRGTFFNDTPPVFYAAATSNLSVGASEADVPGATISVTVKGSNSTVLVTGVFDAQTNASSSASISGVLSWAGSDQTSVAVIQTGTATAMRATITQVWRITGVTAGTYTAKLRASGTSGGTVRGTHTTITAVVYEGV